MNDSSDSDRPFGSSQLRVGMKNLNSELEMLTSEKGPLYQLVDEVRKSNLLARSNQVKLMITMFGLVVCIVLLATCVFLMKRTASDLHELSVEQLNALEATQQLVKFAEATDQKVEATQAQLDEAPKVVADEKTGQLMVVATIEMSNDAGSHPVDDAPASATPMVRKRAGGSPLIKPEAPTSTSPRTKEFPKMKRSVQFPIQVDMAEFK